MPADLQLEALPNGHQADFEEKRRDSARDRRGDYLFEEVLASGTFHPPVKDNLTIGVQGRQGVFGKQAQARCPPRGDLEGDGG
jgi:hypothetical protein